MKDDGNQKTDTLNSGYDQIIQDENAKFKKCVEEMEEAKLKCKGLEQDIIENQQKYEKNRNNLSSRNDKYDKDLTELKQNIIDLKKQCETLKETYFSKKKQMETESAEMTKRHNDLEKNNMLLSVQLQSLKFDIDYLNGAVSMMKNASDSNKDKKQNVNRTTITKVLGKTS